jgi:predicted site-specific integrase-resolvase
MATATASRSRRKAPAHSRVDAVFIRKSSQGQNEDAQIDNVDKELKALGISVSDQYRFVGTVKRRRVRGNEGFNRLMELVEADRIGTVYIESQDRWGTADRVELFQLIGILREHNTRLFDLRAKRDVAEKDLTSELLAIVNSIKSEKELQDISYRSLRTRVSNFNENQSWPTGTHPFGYGKACRAEGKLLWVWQPVSRSRGQLFYPDKSGKLSPGPANVKIPQKSNRDITKLVPSNNKNHVATVQLVFNLYTKVGLSRRKISERLNKEGRTFYSKSFTYPFVTQILTNPAYVGDTHFGKTQTGELHSFDNEGRIVTLKGKPEQSQRDVSERIIKKNTHEGLIDRATWKRAQDKLSSERQRVSYPARNPAYYLKQIFVCGHCGKNLTGRSEQGKAFYVCSSYVNGKINGQPTECGYHRISHDDAEKLLMDKINELDLQYDSVASDEARSNIASQVERLNEHDEEAQKLWETYFKEGTQAFLEYIKRECRPNAKALAKLKEVAESFYGGAQILRSKSFDGLPMKIEEFRKIVASIDREGVEKAKDDANRLTEELRSYVKAQATASELSGKILQEEIARVEAEIKDCKLRTVPLTERLKTIWSGEDERAAERRKLRRELPALQNREKGEALRRLFNTVTLFWDRTFIQASEKPTRPRKTNREGRYRYTLRRDKIQWNMQTSNLTGSW